MSSCHGRIDVLVWRLYWTMSNKNHEPSRKSINTFADLSFWSLIHLPWSCLVVLGLQITASIIILSLFLSQKWINILLNTYEIPLRDQRGSSLSYAIENHQMNYPYTREGGDSSLTSISYPVALEKENVAFNIICTSLNSAFCVFWCQKILQLHPRLPLGYLFH